MEIDASAWNVCADYDIHSLVLEWAAEHIRKCPDCDNAISEQAV